MKSSVKKWGNSAAVRIPASIMQTMNLDLDDAVDVREEDGRIIIEPVHKKSYELDALIKGIRTTNLHGPVDSGEPMGKEIW